MTSKGAGAGGLSSSDLESDTNQYIKLQKQLRRLKHKNHKLKDELSRKNNTKESNKLLKKFRSQEAQIKKLQKQISKNSPHRGTSSSSSESAYNYGISDTGLHYPTPHYKYNTSMQSGLRRYSNSGTNIYHEFDGYTPMHITHNYNTNPNYRITYATPNKRSIGTSTRAVTNKATNTDNNIGKATSIYSLYPPTNNQPLKYKQKNQNSSGPAKKKITLRIKTPKLNDDDNQKTVRIYKKDTENKREKRFSLAGVLCTILAVSSILLFGIGVGTKTSELIGIFAVTGIMSGTALIFLNKREKDNPKYADRASHLASTETDKSEQNISKKESKSTDHQTQWASDILESREKNNLASLPNY